jgi:hypothetical protein
LTRVAITVTTTAASGRATIQSMERARNSLWVRFHVASHMIDGVSPQAF